MALQHNVCNFPVRALMLKSYKHSAILTLPANSNDFMSPNGAPAIFLSCAEDANPLRNIPRGPQARAAARA
eukprot:1241074-Pyramimonas_sp.AAC.1